MKIGLLGFPQVGKRTLFRLLTGQAVGSDGANGTMGVARVRDARFDNLVQMYSPAKVTPALMDFLLLPDLENDAERDADPFRGLEQVDVIGHVVRGFADDAVFHLSGAVDAERDIEAVAAELVLNDLLFIEKRLDRLHRERAQKEGAAQRQRENDLLTRMQAHLEAGQRLSGFGLEESEAKTIAIYPFLTRKTMVLIHNVDEAALAAAPDGFDAAAGIETVAVSAKIEEELAELESEERQTFLDDLGVGASALDRLTQVCYRALGYISFCTVGEDEVRAWTIRRDSPAPVAGGAIHSDIEKGFIRAEIMSYGDLAELGSESQAKEAGRLQTRGRDYVVSDGDIIHFLHKT